MDEVDFAEIERNISLEQGTDPQVATMVALSGDDEEKVSNFISGEEAKLILGSSILFDFASNYLNEDGIPHPGQNQGIYGVGDIGQNHDLRAYRQYGPS